MLRHFLKAWKSNRGNLLLVLGVIAGLMMCLVWYFQLVPEVRLISRGTSGTLVSRMQRGEQTLLVATLRIPATAPALDNETPDSQATPLVELHTIVELHSASETLQPEQVPLLSRSVTLRNDGKPLAVVFSDMQPGSYAVLAYIDLNFNDKFDFDESLKAIEPYRLSRGAPAIERKPNHKPEPFNLEEAGVQVLEGQTTLVEFDFRQAKR